MSKKFRAGIALSEVERDRLNVLTEACETNRTAILAAVASVMSVEEVKQLLQRHAELKALEAELHQIATENILRHTRGKSIEDMRKIVQAAKDA